MTAALAAELDPVTSTSATFLAAQVASREQVAVRVLTQVGQVFDALGSAEDGAGFGARVLGIVQAGQRQTAATSASYVAALLDAVPSASRRGVSPVALPPSLRVDVAGGADPTVPYGRPLRQWSRDLAAGVAPDLARARARQRLMVMTDSDMTHAMRESVRQSVADHPDVIAMRRVPHPELSLGGACGLCIAAADRLYSKRLLMPMHNRCQCESMVVTRDHDPGLQLNQADFSLLYGEENRTDRQSLAAQRFRVVDHGELGSQLVRADDTFEGPDRAAAEREQQEAATADVSAIGMAGEPRQMTSDVLDRAMTDALEREDYDRFDVLAAESDRRDAARAAARERRAERTAARDEQRAQEMERRLAGGQDEESAVADVYDIPVDRQRRDRAMALLRNDGYRGASFDELSRASLRDHQERAYWRAEDETRGVLLSREGERAGVDPRSLFVGPEARARRWASDELLAWWDANGRPTLEEWRAELLGMTAVAAQARAAQSGYLA